MEPERPAVLQTRGFSWLLLPLRKWLLLREVHRLLTRTTRARIRVHVQINDRNAHHVSTFHVERGRDVNAALAQGLRLTAAALEDD